MPDIGHIPVGVIAGRWYARGDKGRNWNAIIVFTGLSLLPDCDLAGRWLGFADGTPLGHRGAFHSLGFALLVGAAAAVVCRLRRLPIARICALAVLVVASHGALDMLDTGNLGVEYLWPISSRHYFWPWRFLPGPPPGEIWLSRAGARVVAVETILLSPLFLLAILGA